ncbi:MAG: orotidine-5'-phosphate decarboxylase [candidate division WOR-3 bacterium]
MYANKKNKGGKTLTEIIIALNTNKKDIAEKWVSALFPLVRWFKIGYPLYINAGNKFVKELKEKGAKVFLDLKLFDIPSVVSLAIKEISELGVDMITLHTLGGFEMLESACKTLWEVEEGKRPLLIGVTILTSMSEATLKDVSGARKTMDEEIERLAKLSKSAGLDGVVVSGEEIEIVKKICGKEFLTVVPGIRLKEDLSFDQERIITPREAKEKGADFLVIGRPITHSDNPFEKLKRYLEEIG